MHLANKNQGDFEDDLTVIFNRDMMMDEGQIIENIRNSEGILSDETLIGQHPWVDDAQAELERLEKQKQKEQEEFENGAYPPFGKQEGKQSKGMSDKDAEGKEQ